jgi:hypothetical protein
MTRLLFAELEQPVLPPGITGLAITDGRVGLPLQLFKDRDCTRDAFVVAAYLDSIAADSACWQTDEAIAREMGISRRSVQFGISYLRDQGFIHVDRQRFRGKTRRVLFLLWRVRESLPPLVAEGGPKKGARTCAKKGARPCAKSSAAHCAPINESANIDEETAQNPANSLPISNLVLSSEDSIPLTAAPPPWEKSQTGDVVATAPLPPAVIDPPAAADAIDAAELAASLALLEQPAELLKRLPLWRVEFARAPLAAAGVVSLWPRVSPEPQPPAVIASPPPRPAAASPPPALTPERLDTCDLEQLVKWLPGSVGDDLVDAFSRRMVKLNRDPYWRDYYAKQARLVQAGEMPPEVLLDGLRSARSYTAGSGGKTFSGKIRAWQERRAAEAIASAGV